MIENLEYFTLREINLYLTTIKRIIDQYHEKEVVFYDEEGNWYSRLHCEYLSPKELCDWILEIAEEIDEE